MIRFALLLLLSFAVSSQATAAVKWNNSGGEQSKSDPTNFWDRTKNAKKCFGPEFDHFSDKISIKKITVQDKDFAAINAPLGANTSVNCKFNYSSQLVPQPLIDAKINSKYGGSDNKRFQPLYEFLNTNIGLNRFEPNGAAQGRLKEFLITWSSANALSKNVRFKLMEDFRLDFHVQSLIPTIIIAYSDISGSLSTQERIQVGQWINRLVEQSQKSAFPFRQDNKSYLRHLTALLWGIVIDNEGLIKQAKQGYQNAILDMRPDGTFPTDVSRGGSGLQYQNTVVNVLVSMAGYSTLIGENWIEYEINGRSIRDAAKWIDKASADPSLNSIYGRKCDDGSYGTIEKPNMYYLQLQNTGETGISWVPLYLTLTNDTLNFLSKNIRDYKGYWSTSYGPQACIVNK